LIGDAWPAGATLLFVTGLGYPSQGWQRLPWSPPGRSLLPEIASRQRAAQ
jgi:hypothetical protein